jgi:hypothetical protein
LAALLSVEKAEMRRSTLLIWLLVLGVALWLSGQSWTAIQCLQGA